jgi:hypothetical protein
MSTEPYDGFAITPSTARQLRDHVLTEFEPALTFFVNGGYTTHSDLGWGRGKVVVSNGEHVSVACTRQDTFRALVHGLSELNYTIRTEPCSIGYGLAVMDAGEGRQQRAFVWLAVRVNRWLDEAAKETVRARRRIAGV